MKEDGVTRGDVGEQVSEIMSRLTVVVLGERKKSYGLKMNIQNGNFDVPDGL